MHGGDIYSNQVDLDYSVNLNPLGCPVAVREAIADACSTVDVYPDPSYRQLRKGIAARYGIPVSRIVVGNGASELIMAVCRAILGRKRSEEMGDGSAVREKILKISSEKIVPEEPVSEEKAIKRKLSGKSASEKTTGKALILAPGFTGYRRALQAVQAEVISFPLREDNGWVPDDSLEQTIRREQPQLVMLSNPSNPTGVLLPFSRMLHLAQVCKEVGAIVCVDECFMEMTDSFAHDSLIRCCRKAAVLQDIEGTQIEGTQNKSSERSRMLRAAAYQTGGQMTKITHVEDGTQESSEQDKGKWVLDGSKNEEESISNLIVLNAVTKTYAIPGVRLGYAFCSTDTLADRIQAQLPEWNISTIAQAAGLQAMKTDPLYLEETNQLLRQERAYLMKKLTACGLRVTPSQAAFLLFYSPVDLYHPLLEQKTLIRDCSDYEGLAKGWYRIAIRQHEDNVTLVRQLQACMEEDGCRRL